MVLNKFFGTVINAAYGISLQINAALGAVSGFLRNNWNYRMAFRVKNYEILGVFI